MTALIDHNHYNSLASLEEVNIFRQTPSIDDIINGPIRDVFLKHGVHTLLCLYLQHRHHTVSAGEVVVKVEGTAHLMDGQAIEDIVSFGNKIVPTTWMVSNGSVHLMEFAVVPSATTTTATTAPTPAFLADLLLVLTSNGCDRLFGIDTLAKSAWSEMKIGGANVVVPSEDIESYDKDKFIPVAFAFDAKKPKFRVHGKCKTDHKHSSKPVK